MNGRRPRPGGRLWIPVALCCIGLVAASARAAPSPLQTTGDGDVDTPRTVESAEDPSDTPIEEVLVTGEKVDDLSWGERREIYKQLAKGRRLYSRSDYKGAFPLLLNTAEHGFKDAQARVGYIYLRGLGEVPRDSAEAIGWLGVAASGNSDPGIENYFNDIWSRIPEQYVPYFEEVVEEYASKFGEDATGVTCELRRPLGSHLKRLTCYFDKDLTLEELEFLEDIQAIRVEPVIPVRQPEDRIPLAPVSDDSD